MVRLEKFKDMESRLVVASGRVRMGGVRDDWVQGFLQGGQNCFKVRLYDDHTTLWLY